MKNISQVGHLPQIGVKKKYLKPPTSKSLMVGAPKSPNITPLVHKGFNQALLRETNGLMSP